MTVVIDTPVLLPVLSAKHPHGAVLDAWIAGNFAWAVSPEILFEYEEVVPPRIGPKRWDDLMNLFKNVLAAHSNLRRVTPAFRWHLITAAPDDDKFADCAIAAEAEWIITENRNFSVLETSGHPTRSITPAGFIRRFPAFFPAQGK